ncbi:MAG TPA: tRNA (N(6)-L-threonylcarbamoyladenosine(37)-C(2))-methylthiotransferase MtaB [Bacteroidales bacterium]|nr:tRNA (N(6)-L-threonylcarbamoyladenosine(37)-C(2))-methylthiotransferase MtaB [Bacteroidales bacterium]
MSDRKIKVAFHTLGCKLNFSETSAISRKMEDASYQRVPFTESADIYVIHGCTVTGAADKKCRQVIKQTIRRSPASFIVVAGCYAQLRYEEIAGIPGVDLILGTNEKYDILNYLGDTSKRKEPEIHHCGRDELLMFNPSFSGSDRTRAFLKIQDGCDYSCSYCTIPIARGRSRNQPISACVRDAVKIAELGIKEIVLTGVNIGDFGKSTGETFHDLLKELSGVKGIERYRISSVEPNLLTDDIIELVARSKKIQPHFHIPLQSGSDKILAKMRRRYTREVFTSRVKKIREFMPLAGIGADVIVGFPGETENDFIESYEFLLSLDLSYLHVFSYSERDGTPAADMPGQIDKSIKNDRSKKLHELSELKKRKFNEKCSGMQVDVLWETEEKTGYISGFTGNYIRVFTEYDHELEGKIKAHTLGEIVQNGNFTV